MSDPKPAEPIRFELDDSDIEALKFGATLAFTIGEIEFEFKLRSSVLSEFNENPTKDNVDMEDEEARA